MRYEVMSEEDVKKARTNTFEAGEYDFTVVEAEDTFSKSSGKEMFKLTLGVYVGDKKRSVFDYVMAEGKMAWKLRHLCDSLGILDKYETGALISPDLTGKSGKAKFDVQEGEGSFSDKNVVVDYIKRSTGAFVPSGHPVAAAPDFDSDEIPF